MPLYSRDHASKLTVRLCEASEKKRKQTEVDTLLETAFLKAKPYPKSLANLALLLKSFMVGGPLIITLLFNPVQELLHE